MDYKEKYEQALKVAKETYDKQPMYRDWLDKMFPELKESEDGDNKRISKEITQFLKQNNGWNREWLAWLEKQGEKKPEENKGNIGEISPNWSEEDEHRIKDTIYFLDTAKKHYASTVELDACIDWLKSLKQRIGE